MQDKVLSITNEASYEEWSDYVATNRMGTIYHLPGWKRALESTFGYKSFYRFARDEHGKLCGILPLMLVNSWLTGSRLVSLPFSYICGPIYDSPAALSVLLQEAISIRNITRAKHIELRLFPNSETDINGYLNKLKFSELNDFVTFHLHLGDQNNTWKKLDPKSTRWAIRKAKKDGVQIKQGTDKTSLRSFYKLNLETKSRLGVPAHPLNFLMNIRAEFPDNSSLYLAEYHGHDIAGILNLEYKNIVIYGYGAASAKYRKHNPNSLLLWSSIENSIDRGKTIFDFGRASDDECGLSSFKKHWGTEKVPLLYYYYPKIPHSIRLEKGIRYKFATSVWKLLPLPVARLLSDIVFKHLG